MKLSQTAIDADGLKLIRDLYSKRKDQDAEMIRALCKELEKYLLPKVKARKSAYGMAEKK